MTFKIHQKYYQVIDDNDVDKLLKEKYLPTPDLFKVIYSTENNLEFTLTATRNQHIVFMENNQVKIKKFRSKFKLPFNLKLITQEHAKALVLAARKFSRPKMDIYNTYDLILCRNIKDLFNIQGINIYRGHAAFYAESEKLGRYEKLVIQFPELEKNEIYMVSRPSSVGYIISSRKGSLAYVIAERMVRLTV